MLATVASATLIGISGHPVSVEVHVGPGLPSFALVGLPDAACREARDRVRAAIISSGLDWPLRRITVNLAPSSLPKHGTGLDLAVAVGVLAAAGAVPIDAVAGRGFLGELGLDGSVRAVRGTVALAASGRGRLDALVVGTGAAAQAALVPGCQVLAADDLDHVVGALRGDRPWGSAPEPPPTSSAPGDDLADVRGHAVARRVLEVAAAGSHHLLLSGPPGAGKTMLARRLPGILPDLTDDEALEVTAIHSAGGEHDAPTLIRRPPFRAPHHTATAVALVGGGGGAMRPGEISFAHRGVLFADELGEFAPTVLDALRQPLERGTIQVSRAAGSVRYPARFLLVAATNPCPCGPQPSGCRCSEASRARYRRRLSGPLLDRFDLRLDVARPDPAALLSDAPGESSAAVAQRVVQARVRLLDPDAGAPPVGPEARHLLESMLRRGLLSARGATRVRRVATTVQALDGGDGPLDEATVAAALALRPPPTSSADGMAS